MRRVLQIVLLLSFAASLVGTTTLMVVLHQRGRSRVETTREALRERGDLAGMSHLVVLLNRTRAGNPSFVRIGRNEVVYEGALYDVVFEEVRGDTLHLWGFRDHEEQEAATRLAAQYDGARRNEGLAAAQSAAAGLRLLCCSVTASAIGRPSPQDHRYPMARRQAIPSPIGEVPHPPPRG